MKRLIEWLVDRAIRGYAANILAVTKAIESGWIPEGEEPGVAEQLRGGNGWRRNSRISYV